jgi:PAS domain S-box-containing protein
VGDRAQARGGFPESWEERLARVGFGETAIATLSINYRTPEEVMREAEPLIRAVLPDAQSYLAAPLRKHDQTLGLLRIDSHIPDQFSQRDVQRLQPLINIAAIALENSHLFETLEKRLAELEAVRRAGLSIISSLKIQAVLQTILNELFQLFADVTNTHIFLYDGDWLTFGAAFWDGTFQLHPISQPRKDGLTYEVARSGQMLIIPEMETHPLYAETILTTWAKSIIGLPLKIGERVVGVMNIAFKQVAQPTELSTLKLLADQAAIAIENARLYGKMQQEIRERHQVEAALRYSEERHRLISELTSDFAYGLHVYSDRTITIDWITDAFTRIIGYGISEWNDQVLLEMVHPQDKAIIRQRAKAIYEGQSFVSEFRIITKNKETRWLRDHIQPVQSMDVGMTNYVYGATQDITEQKQIAEAMVNAQKLEGLGVVASGIAHDFNNVLTAVITQTSNALLHLPEDHPARQNIQQIAQVSEDATSLTRQLLTYAGEAQYQLVPLDLNKTVTEIILLLRRTISKSISLNSTLAPGLPHVLADVGQIQQVIMNLVVNAAESYQGTPGTVEISTSVQAGSNHASETALATICLSVSDKGLGMDKETADRIYDPFFSTKFQGRGLGLAAVQGIVRAHRGEIRLTTAIQQGTTFTVQLPAAINLPPVAAPKPPAIVASTSSVPELILIIDDEKVVRTALVEFLQLRGYKVLAADNGRNGIDLFQQHQNEISLILLDMTMPVMGGPEAFGHLRQLAPTIPVLFLSGLNEPEELRQHVGQKGTDFLKKPFRLDQLMKKIEEVMVV